MAFSFDPVLLDSIVPSDGNDATQLRLLGTEASCAAHVGLLGRNRCHKVAEQRNQAGDNLRPFNFSGLFVAVIDSGWATGNLHKTFQTFNLWFCETTSGEPLHCPLKQVVAFSFFQMPYK